MKEVKIEIEKKLENLLVIGSGLNQNTQDKERFFDFVVSCHKENYLMENILHVYVNLRLIVQELKTVVFVRKPKESMCCCFTFL